MLADRSRPGLQTPIAELLQNDRLLKCNSPRLKYGFLGLSLPYSLLCYSSDNIDKKYSKQSKAKTSSGHSGTTVYAMASFLATVCHFDLTIPWWQAISISYTCVFNHILNLITILAYQDFKIACYANRHFLTFI